MFTQKHFIHISVEDLPPAPGEALLKKTKIEIVWNFASESKFCKWIQILQVNQYPYEVVVQDNFIIQLEVNFINQPEVDFINQPEVDFIKQPEVNFINQLEAIFSRTKLPTLEQLHELQYSREYF